MELWILRHAKARSALPDEFDRDRPLSDAGRDHAERLHDWLSTCERKLPETLLVSPALRTRQTAEKVFADLSVPPLYDERLWEADADDLRAVLDEHASENDRLALVGHNPGLEWLVGWLTGQRLALGLQPGGLVIIDCQLPIGAGSGRIEWLLQPSDLV